MVGEITCTITGAVPDFVASCVLVAVTVTLPAEAGAVNNPLELMLPPLALQVTAELKLPVPCTVAVHCDVAFVLTVVGLQLTATEVMVGATVWTWTLTGAVPDFVASWVLVAVTVTLPAEAGAVKSPLELMLPPLALQVTAELKLPVPCTVAVHCDVPFVLTAVGLQLTATEVMVGATVWTWTLTGAVPDFVASWVLVAVTVTLPAEAGAVNSPLALMLPPLALHVTAELKLPVP